MQSSRSVGFTLIELSIVLVIIGLITGGILVGQELIHAATIRAQITQIEKYNAAVNAFRGKYGYLPGDIPEPIAGQYGFFLRAGGFGNGDGDGYVSGVSESILIPQQSTFTLGGENVLFWTDLTASGLISGGFNDSTDALVNVSTDAQYAAEMPRANIGNGNYVYVNGNYFNATDTWVMGNGFQLIRIIAIGNPSYATGMVALNPGLTPLDSYNIDKKIDDGYPMTGSVYVMQPDSSGFSIAGEQITAANLCANAGTPMTYNTGTTGVSNVANCSLRFKATW